MRDPWKILNERAKAVTDTKREMRIERAKIDEESENRRKFEKLVNESLKTVYYRTRMEFCRHLEIDSQEYQLAIDMHTILNILDERGLLND